MTVADDLFLRRSKVMSFDGAASDADGRELKLYSVVTPIHPVSQHFEDGAAPIEIAPGARLVVLGAPDGDTRRLWLEVDDKDHAWTGATVVLSAHQVRYLCEVGEDLHMKARH